MKITKVSHSPFYQKLGQNIYRHDGLMALARGTVLKLKEMTELEYRGIEYILTYDSASRIGELGDVNFLLNIIEEAFRKTTIWEEAFGERYYEFIHQKIIKNKMILSMLDEIRTMDSYSFAHMINISMIVASVLKNHNQHEEKFIFEMGYIALVHDVGRLKMIELFTKEGKLNNKEFEQIKKHPIESLKLLKKAGFLEEEIGFIAETHEKVNGTGYPFRLEGGQIPSVSQLILIADMYNALSSFRPHRDVYTPYEAVKMLEEEINVSFDKEIVELFRSAFRPYKKGMQVLLSDGSNAVVKTIRTNPLLPVVSKLSEVTGQEEGMIDLTVEREIRIAQILI